MLSRRDQNLIRILKHRLQEVAGEQLITLIVFGSRAWGQASADSDLDIAVIIQDCTPELEKSLSEAAYQVMWDHDFTPVISLKVIDAKRFKTYQDQGFTFYRKLAQDGIAL